jgi:hypothetical protein
VPAEGVVVVFVGGALLLAALVWVGAPLWRGTGPEPPPDGRIVLLLAQREATLAAIRDLDADLAVGRIEDAEHDRRRREQVARGAALLQSLDAVGARSAGEAAVLAAQVDDDVRALLAPTVASRAD